MYESNEQPKPFQTEKPELIFGLLLALCCLLTVNCTLFGGLNLGFAVGAVLCLGLSFFYLLRKGNRPTGYSLAIFLLCCFNAAGFARSSDGFVKFVLAQFLFLGSNLCFSLMTGRNRFCPGRLSSLGDSFLTAFGMGLRKLAPAFQGLAQAFRSSGRLGRGAGAVLLGLCIAFPLLLVVVPLLISADAAFDGLVSLLPSFDLQEALSTLLFGCLLFCPLYARSTGLIHSQPAPAEPKTHRKGLLPATVNTVLAAIFCVYAAYLVSQLAYFFGGFSGLLPEEYTLAEYARRGFFEMAALSVINLGTMTFCLGLVRKEDSAPLSTRLLCLFLGVVSLFLIATASAKMFLYIESYGLTRLRLLTQTIMLFLAFSTGIVCVWLFVPKLPYMKVIFLAALVIGAAVIWLDVDNMVAGYNVDAYLSGRLQAIDTRHLGNLGSSAVPHIARLAQEAKDSSVAQAAKNALAQYPKYQWDLRSWNWSVSQALRYLPK